MEILDLVLAKTIVKGTISSRVIGGAKASTTAVVIYMH